MSSYGCGAKGATAFAEVLKVNTTLTTLEWHNRNIREGGAESLLNALEEHNTTLTQLVLHPNGYILPAIRSFIGGLVEANKSGIRLLHVESELDLSGKRINGKQAKVFGKELASNATVNVLFMSNNDIDDKSSVDIAEAFVTNRALMSIRLDENCIGHAGSLAIAAALLENKVLTGVFLNGNNLGPGGAVVLAETLRTNTILQELGLGRNGIGTEGALVIADALRINTTLTGIYLDGNGISDEGAVEILTVLKGYNHTLATLNLQCNKDISPILLASIQFLVASHLAINHLRKRLHKPLENRVIPFAILAVQRDSISHRRGELSSHGEAAISPIFCLVKATATNDANVINSQSDDRFCVSGNIREKSASFGAGAAPGSRPQNASRLDV
jgi:Leucine Rich repeat